MARLLRVGLALGALAGPVVRADEPMAVATPQPSDAADGEGAIRPSGQRGAGPGTGVSVLAEGGVLVGPGSPVRRPEAAQRVVRVFDFERRLDQPGLAELYDVPRFWDLAQDGSPVAGARPGYPPWNRAALDDAHAASGSTSLRLDAMGGSVALRLQAGVAPVFPRTQYLLSARVRGEGFEHARARLRTRYLDAAGKPIAGSEAVGELTPGASWSLVTATLSGGFDGASMVQIDLEVAQPEQREAGREGDAHRIWAQDLSARAWFDDVAIVQLPRVELSVESPGAVALKPDKPTLSVAVRDLTGDGLTASLIVQDAAGEVVDRDERAMVGGANRWGWTPRLPRLGWYRATLELRAAGRRVGSTAADFVWGEPSRGSGAGSAGPTRDQRQRWGVEVDEVPPSAGCVAGTRALVRASGAGSVTLPTWTESMTLAEARAVADRLGPLVAELGAEGRRVGVSLPVVPTALAGPLRVAPEEVPSVFERELSSWESWLLPVLDRVGQSVQRWQVGRPSWTLPEEPGLGAAYLGRAEPGVGRLGAKLTSLVPGPVVVRPAPLEAALSPALSPGAGWGSEVLVSVPAELGSRGVRELASARLSEAAGMGVGVTFVVAARAGEDGLAEARRVVRQAVGAWAALTMTGETASGEAGAEVQPRGSVSLAQPWSWVRRPGLEGDPQPMPGPSLAAWATAVRGLAGRRAEAFQGSGEGIEAWILAPLSGTGPGALVAWRDGPSAAGISALEARLAVGPVTAVDLFGNRRTVEVTRGAGGREVHRIELTEEPVFVEGVDVELARFLAAFSVSPRGLSASGAQQPVRLRMTNPWSSRLSGRVTILEPGGYSSSAALRDRAWRYTPRTQPIALNPGQSIELEMGVTVSPVEEAGPRLLGAEVELAVAGRQYPPVWVTAPVEIELEGLELEVAARVVGADVVVESRVVNNGKTAVTLSLGLFAPGRPRERASVSDLPPEASALRRFTLPGAAAELRGRRVSVSLQPVERAARLTRSAVVE